MSGERRQIVPDLRRPEVHPSDHSLDEGMFVRQGKKPAGFCKGLPGLDGNGTFEAMLRQMRDKIRRKKIPFQNRESLRNPRIFLG